MKCTLLIVLMLFFQLIAEAQPDNIKRIIAKAKAGLGGLVEGEISGRLALEGGASIDSDAGFITPEIPDLGDIK